MRKNPLGVVIVHLTAVSLHPDFTRGKFEISNFDVGVENAIAHDFLYSELKTFDMFRRDADMAFYSGLRNSNLEVWKSKLFYCAVIIAGGKHWKKKI
jgi:hypothetical protein